MGSSAVYGGEDVTCIDNVTLRILLGEDLLVGSVKVVIYNVDGLETRGVFIMPPRFLIPQTPIFPDGDL